MKVKIIIKMKVTQVLLVSVLVQLYHLPEVTCVFGGRLVNVSDYPFMAYIYSSGSPSPYYECCGASIIGPRWVLTSAECLTKSRAEQIYILSGFDTFIDENLKYTTSKVERGIIYPEHAEGSYRHNIAVVYTKEPIKFGEKISPIELPEPGTENKYPYGLVFGWGEGAENKKREVLTAAFVAIQFNREKCWDILPNIDKNGIMTKENIFKTLICGGDEYGPCKGDGGGPLVVRNRNNQFVVIGIIPDRDYGMCNGKLPLIWSLYTPVNQYVTWIRQIMDSVNETLTNN